MRHALAFTTSGEGGTGRGSWPQQGQVRSTRDAAQSDTSSKRRWGKVARSRPQGQYHLVKRDLPAAETRLTHLPHCLRALAQEGDKWWDGSRKGVERPESGEFCPEFGRSPCVAAPSRRRRTTHRRCRPGPTGRSRSRTLLLADVPSLTMRTRFMRSP